MYKNEKIILECLKTKDQWWTTKQVCTKTGINYRHLSSILTRMTEKHYLKRERNPLGAWRYKLDLVKWEPQKLQRAINLSATKELQRISSSELFAALQIFSRGHKKPKFIETGAYTHYGQTVGGLYKHAVETSYGAAPSRDELKYYRRNLQDYADQLEAHLRGVHAILDTEDVWDPHQTTGFLLQGIADTDRIKELAEKAIKENQ